MSDTTRDYIYSAPSLDELLRSADPGSLTLRAVFDAGERYGADLQRGATWSALPDLAAEAAEDGRDLIEYVQDCLAREGTI